MDEVLERALTRRPEPIEWEEQPVKPVPEPQPVEEEATSPLTAH